MAASTKNGAHPVIGLGSTDSNGIVHRFDFTRPACKDTDIRIDIEYCGMCHSDLHTIRGEWGHIDGRMCPGHEIFGTVVEVGSAVDRFAVGQKVGVGCMVGSCGNCEQCKAGLEQHCDSGMVGTYNAKFRAEDGCDLKTQGGYTTGIVVDQHFVMTVPEGANLPLVGPLLCAGITTYSPLMQYGPVKGKTVAVAGLGGLGHMAVKIAKAMGAKVIVLSRSEKKKAQAEALGCELIAHGNAEAIKANRRTVDLIINTIPFHHDPSNMLPLLKVAGTMCFLGGVKKPMNFSSFTLLGGRINLTGSLIGGIKETQEMLDFCVKHNIYPEAEIITADKVNDALDILMEGGTSGRFVIDMKASKFEDLPVASAEELKQTKVPKNAE